MSGAMAFLAGMGTGYIDGKKRKQDQDRLDAKDKREQTLFDSQMDKINQDKADRTALKYAGETVTARPLEGPQPEAAYVNGQEPAEPIGYISGNGPSARTFAGNGIGQEQAATNAMEQNKPGAWETRAANLARQGNAFAATALANNASIRNNTAQAGIAEQTLADQTTARSIQTLADFDAVGTYISDSPADNNGGKFKGKFMPSADGKTQVFNRLNDDGTYTPTQRVFPNTSQGLTQAKEALAGAMTPEQRRVQAQHIFSNELAEKNFTLSERKTSVAEKQAAIADRKIDYLMYGAAAKARAGVGGGAGSGAPGVALKDRREYLSDFSAGLEDPKTALDANEAAAIQQRNQTNLVQADAIFSTNAELGTVLTAPQARAAMSLAQDPKNVRKVQDNNTGTVYEVVNVNGKPVVVGAGQIKPAAPVAPVKAQEAVSVTPPKPPAKAIPQPSATGPTWTKWKEAKAAKDKLLSDASKMSPENAEQYIATRLPEIDKVIKANENYTQQ